MNSILRAAIEAHNTESNTLFGAAAVSPAASTDSAAVLADTTNPEDTGDSEASQKLIVLQEEASQMHAELANARADSEEVKTAEYVDALESCVYALESLLNLGGTVAAAIESGQHSETANCGFAIALESITTRVGITDALEDAASSSRALAIHELKDAPRATKMEAEAVEEQAKTGGILETIKKKAVAVWEFCVRIARQVVDRISDMLQSFVGAKTLFDGGGISEREIDTYMRTDMDKRKPITDKAIIKQLGVIKDTDFVHMLRASVGALKGTRELLQYAPEFTKAVVSEVNAVGGTGINRNAVIESCKKYASILKVAFHVESEERKAGEMTEEVKRSIRDKNAEINSSPRLIGGYFIWSEVSKAEEGKMPKVGLYSARDRFDEKDLADEIPPLDNVTLNMGIELISSIEDQTKSKARLTEMAANIQRLRKDAPSRFTNIDKIEDDIAFVSAAMGSMGKMSAELTSTIINTLQTRVLFGIRIYLQASIKATFAKAAFEGPKGPF